MPAGLDDFAGLYGGEGQEPQPRTTETGKEGPQGIKRRKLILAQGEDDADGGGFAATIAGRMPAVLIGWKHWATSTPVHERGDLGEQGLGARAGSGTVARERPAFFELVENEHGG